MLVGATAPTSKAGAFLGGETFQTLPSTAAEPTSISPATEQQPAQDQQAQGLPVAQSPNAREHAAITGAVADYPGSNQYRARGLPLPYFIYRGDIFRSDANGPRLQKSSGIVDWELSGSGNLSSNSRGGARSGMPTLDYLLEAGPKAKITLSKPTDTSRLALDVALRAAASTNFSSRFSSRGGIFAPDLAYDSTRYWA